MHKMIKKKLFYFFICLLFNFAIISCNGEKEKKQPPPTTKKETVKPQVASVDESTKKMLEIAEKINEESDREVDENGVLHITVYDAAIPISKDNELISKLFPNSKIKKVKDDKLFKAFNISKEEANYNAVIVVENLENKKIMGVVCISEGNFDMKIIGDLFM